LTFDAPASDSCPLLRGANVRHLDGFSYEVTSGKGGATYAAVFDPLVADPDKTYILAQFNFDHSNVFDGAGTRADGCGCIDRPVCISIAKAVYFDVSSDEKYFWAEREYLTWNDPTNSLTHCPGVEDCLQSCDPHYVDIGCGITPPTAARQSTWGSLKAAYR
jgi:hypothetical protein